MTGSVTGLRIHKAEWLDGEPIVRGGGERGYALFIAYLTECDQRAIPFERIRQTWRGVTCRRCLARRPK